MEEQQDDMMERAYEEREDAEIFTSKTICGILLFIVFIVLLGLIVVSIRDSLSDTTIKNLCAFLSCLLVGSLVVLFGGLYSIAIQRNTSITPDGLHRRAAQGGQPAVVQRNPEIGQRRNINVAGASRSSQASLLDTAPGPSGLQNPVVLARSEQSCHTLQLGQQRTQAESIISEEGSSLLSSISRESSADSKMSDVASGVSDMSSIRTSGRERIRTRSMTRKQLDEASSAGHRIDPSEPGPSRLRSPERSLRNLRSKKTDSESKQSDRRSVPRSEKSTASSGGVRRREKFATRKASLEKKLDYYYSESSDSE